MRQRAGQKNADSQEGRDRLPARSAKPAGAREPQRLERAGARSPIMTEPYKGEDGGLYGGGKNEPPAEHLAAHLKEVGQHRAFAMQRRQTGRRRQDWLHYDRVLQLRPSNRWISSALRTADPQKASNVVIVNGCIGGRSAVMWAWDGADILPKAEQERLDARRWICCTCPRAKRKSTVRTCEKDTWPTLAQAYRRRQPVAPRSKCRCAGSSTSKPTPSRLVNSRRTCAGLAGRHHRHPATSRGIITPTSASCICRAARSVVGQVATAAVPEPYAYESGFGTRWVVQSQIKGDAQLNFDPARGEVKAPFVLWGPYLWAQGDTPRKLDGLTWTQNDVRPDQLHPKRVRLAKRPLRSC